MEDWIRTVLEYGRDIAIRKGLMTNHAQIVENQEHEQGRWRRHSVSSVSSGIDIEFQIYFLIQEEREAFHTRFRLFNRNRFSVGFWSDGANQAYVNRIEIFTSNWNRLGYHRVFEYPEIDRNERKRFGICNFQYPWPPVMQDRSATGIHFTQERILGAEGNQDYWCSWMEKAIEEAFILKAW